MIPPLPHLNYDCVPFGPGRRCEAGENENRKKISRAIIFEVFQPM